MRKRWLPLFLFVLLPVAITAYAQTTGRMAKARSALPAAAQTIIQPTLTPLRNAM